MFILSQGFFSVHPPEAKEVLSDRTKSVIKTRPTKMIPRSQWSCDSNAQESRKGWERDREILMGKSLQGGPRPTKGRGSHAWDCWEGTGINKAVSHRPECANGLCLATSVSHREKSGISSSGSPGRRGLASACVTGSSQLLLTPTTYSAAKCNMLCCYLAVIC